MIDIMLDLETMSDTADAAIVAIGACKFDPATGTIVDTFSSGVDLESAVQGGGKISAGTVMWWLRRSEAARAELRSHRRSLTSALLLFTAWLDQDGDRLHRRIWGNGADFDNVILGSAYERLHLEVPWEYYHNRCYRTARNLLPRVEVPKIGTAHCAVDDAVNQATYLCAALQAANLQEPNNAV